MSSITSVTAIRVDDLPCCVEILVAGIDRTIPEHAVLLGMEDPGDEGLVVLDLDTAQSLRARLDGAIRALETSGVPLGVS
jgi:hypothetical protein